jgi:hypothetical protein
MSTRHLEEHDVASFYFNRIFFIRLLDLSYFYSMLQMQKSFRPNQNAQKDEFSRHEYGRLEIGYLWSYLDPNI